MILALGQVASSIGFLVEQADEALKGLGTLLNTWATLETKLDSVIKNVDNGRQGEHRQVTISIFVNTSEDGVGQTSPTMHSSCSAPAKPPSSSNRMTSGQAA